MIVLVAFPTIDAAAVGQLHNKSLLLWRMSARGLKPGEQYDKDCGDNHSALAETIPKTTAH